MKTTFVWYTVTGFDWLLHRLDEYPNGDMICTVYAIGGQSEKDPMRTSP